MPACAACALSHGRQLLPSQEFLRRQPCSSEGELLRQQLTQLTQLNAAWPHLHLRHSQQDLLSFIQHISQLSYRQAVGKIRGDLWNRPSRIHGSQSLRGQARPPQIDLYRCLPAADCQGGLQREEKGSASERKQASGKLPEQLRHMSGCMREVLNSLPTFRRSRRLNLAFWFAWPR